MKKIVVLFFLISSNLTTSQAVPKNFSQLSSPIRIWVLLHPFKAKKAQQISIEANRVSDSIRKTVVLDGDASGGQVDAFRHGYWMARLKQEIGERAAKSLGQAYERANKLQFKKGKLEDGVLPDKPSRDMDLFNNFKGLSLVSKKTRIPKSGIVYRVINAILDGKMKIIKKDKKGNFLTCDSQIIDSLVLIRKWNNEKCLVSSNQTME